MGSFIGIGIITVPLCILGIIAGIYITVLTIKALRRAIIALDIYNSKNGYFTDKESFKE